MKLLLDIGNSRIKWALADAQGLHSQHAVTHADLVAAQLQLEESIAPHRISRVLVSNVAGAGMATHIAQWVSERWNIKAEFALSMPQHGEVINAYANPSTLGVDRWLALLGARALNHATPARADAMLIVDVGTAMTLDAMDGAGRHLGGQIVPGPQLMMRSLLRNTSDIAGFARQGKQGAAFFADNTQGGVYQGALQATAAAIERAFIQCGIQTNSTPQVLISGGDSECILPLLSMQVKTVPDLVLRGLLVALP